MPTSYNSSITAGAIHEIGSTNIPDGYLECNGKAVSRTTYSRLFSVIGTTYGVGDNLTTFNLPDKRWSFSRGYSPNIATSGSNTQIGTVTVTTNGTTTSASFTITNFSSTSSIYVGMAISGTNIPAGATVNSILNSTSIRISSPCTGSGTVALTFTANRAAAFFSHGFNRSGVKVRLTGGTLSGLSTGTDYYTIYVNDNALAFAATRADALAATPSGLTGKINISGNNTATIVQYEDPGAASRLNVKTGGTEASLGSVQDDVFGYHDHGGGNHTHTVSGGRSPSNADSGSSRFGIWPVTTDPSGNIIVPQGGDETRPKNNYSLYVIKY